MSKKLKPNDKSENKDYKKKDNRDKKNSKPNGAKRDGGKAKIEDPKLEYSKHRVEIESQGNDVHWYLNNPALIASASKLPFATQLGRKLNAANSDGFETVPGLMAIRMVPGPGIASVPSDAVNIAAMNLFQYVRKNLSTSASYQPADMMMYIMAMDSIYANFQFIQRLFNISSAFNGENLYYPDALLHAQGFDAAGVLDFRKNYANYYFRFLTLVDKANELYLPVDFNIIKRHMGLFGNLYEDNASTKAQTYMYVPAGFHEWNEDYDDNGTMLTFRKLNLSTLSMWECLDLFESQINSLFNSDSMYKIVGDMKRAFEGKDSFRMEVAPANAVIMAKHDGWVLHQLMNGIIHPAHFLTNGNFDITQDVSHATIVYEPTVDLSSQSANVKNLLDNWSAIVDAGGVVLNVYGKDTPEVIVEGTRNITVYDVATDKASLTFRSTGADICVGARIYYMVPDATGDFRFSYTQYYSYSASALEYLKYLHCFNYANNLYVCSTNEEDPNMVPLITFDNYTQISRDNIEMLNTATMLSLWSVPEFVHNVGNPIKQS